MDSSIDFSENIESESTLNRNDHMPLHPEFKLDCSKSPDLSKLESLDEVVLTNDQAHQRIEDDDEQ